MLADFLVHGDDPALGRGYLHLFSDTMTTLSKPRTLRLTIFSHSRTHPEMIGIRQLRPREIQRIQADMGLFTNLPEYR